jgi:hypothetical protein
MQIYQLKIIKEIFVKQFFFSLARKLNYELERLFNKFVNLLNFFDGSKIDDI